MSDEIRLSAEPRTQFGKGFARRTRKAGRVPAVLYGRGADPVHLSVEALEFNRAIKAGANSVLTIELEGKDLLALPKSVVRHPTKDYVEHVDLLTIKRGELVHVDVEVHVTGEAAPGSLVITDLDRLTVDVDAFNIPDSFELDITDAEIGTQFLAGQIALPDGCTLVTDPEALVVAISHAPTAEEVEAADSDVAAELGIEEDQPEAAESTEKSEDSDD